MWEKIVAAYFSPTGGTRAAALATARAFGAPVEELDLSAREGEERRLETELAVVAVPVFGGRIPGVAAGRLRRLSGERTRAVALAVYGGRAYEDALLELSDLLEERGFQVTAAAAAVAQHSILPELAAGRPDGDDCMELTAFAARVREKLMRGDDSPCAVPGNRPYRQWTPSPEVPEADGRCVRCGKCAGECPVGAIDPGRPERTDRERCIGCMRCVARCPVQARALPREMRERLRQKLTPFLGVRRENEFFL